MNIRNICLVFAFLFLVLAISFASDAFGFASFVFAIIYGFNADQTGFF
jgi:hypothetical protein